MTEKTPVAIAPGSDKIMIIAKSAKDLDKMRAVGELIAEVREALRVMVEPGISTMDLNNAAEKMIRDAGALPTFIGYHGFPYAICASVNDEIVHGFSKTTPLKEGDIASLDMAATYHGFVGDTAMTVPVGKISDELVNPSIPGHIEVLIKQGEGEAGLAAALDDKLPDNCVRIAAGHPSTAALGPMFGAVTLDKITARQVA